MRSQDSYTAKSIVQTTLSTTLTTPSPRSLPRIAIAAARPSHINTSTANNDNDQTNHPVRKDRGR